MSYSQKSNVEAKSQELQEAKQESTFIAITSNNVIAINNNNNNNNGNSNDANNTNNSNNKNDRNNNNRNSAIYISIKDYVSQKPSLIKMIQDNQYLNATSLGIFIFYFFDFLFFLVNYLFLCIVCCNWCDFDYTFV